MNEYNKLVQDLKDIGLEKGMVLLVHSSYKSLEFDDGAPDLVIKALKEVLTSEGTLMMPALTYKKVGIDNPYFSYQDTKSDVGIISEIFRNMPDTKRSLDPIHSVSVWGKYQEELTAGHELDNITLGPNSPFNLMRKYNAKILMLGCGLKPNTFMHLVENHNNVSYRKIKNIVSFTVVDSKGETKIQVKGLPSMKNYDQRYDRIKNILDDNALIEGQILKGKSYLIDANILYIKASEVLKKDELYFVDLI